MEYRTNITFDIGTGSEDVGLAVLQELEREVPDFGAVVGQVPADETLTVTVSFDSSSGEPDVVLGRAMQAIAPALRAVLGNRAVARRAEVDRVETREPASV